MLPRRQFGIGGLGLLACTSGKVSFVPARLSDLMSFYVVVLVIFILINNVEYFL